MEVIDLLKYLRYTFCLLYTSTKAQAAKMSDKELKKNYTVEEDVPEGYNHDEKNDLVLDRVNKKPVIRANNVGKNETHATIAVSYTHLETYLRANKS